MDFLVFRIHSLGASEYCVLGKFIAFRELPQEWVPVGKILGGTASLGRLVISSAARQ